jgi:gentisate 1,2-dioxygenase
MSTTVVSDTGAAHTDLDDLRKAWRAAQLVPLWESPTAHKPPPPPDPAHLWSWETVRPLIARTIDIASPEIVERRVLSLVTPRPKHAEDESTARTLAAALQTLLPGERARPHRHSMNALRFVLEGEGGVTIVNGKECPMAPGDLILTPAWCWHEHVHRGSEPIIWLDALDVPFHGYLGTAAFQPGPVRDMPDTVSDAAYAAPNVVPDVVQQAEYSPVFRYPYETVLAAVANAPPSRDGSRRVRYVNPVTGGSAMALMDCYFVQIDPGQATLPFRTSANAICCVVEGSGQSRVGTETIAWRAKDIFTLPQGNWIEHRSTGGTAQLFVVTDRDLLARLNLLTEDYGNRAA